MTQFTRSMKLECWNTGVDFYVCTPFYIVSNLYKRKSGNLISPMPIELIKGTMQQLGKKHVFQVGFAPLYVVAHIKYIGYYSLWWLEMRESDLQLYAAWH